MVCLAGRLSSDMGKLLRRSVGKKAGWLLPQSRAIMEFESFLAYCHILAILSLTVFIASQAALCRSEWLTAAVVRRLAVLDRWVCIFAAAVLCSGLARVLWGVKGAQWFWAQPLLHIKITLFAVMVGLGVAVHRDVRRWLRALNETGALPDARAIDRTRRLIMIEAHVMTLVPIAAVMLARGVWTR